MCVVTCMWEKGGRFSVADPRAFSENGRCKEGAVTKNPEARKLWHKKLIQIFHD